MEGQIFLFLRFFESDLRGLKRKINNIIDF